MSTWCSSHSCYSNVCGCHSACDPCAIPSSCPIQLDFSCVIYHKSNNEVTELDGLNFNNGATLEAVIEAIDEKVKQLTVTDFTLAYLRASYVVNTLQQFAEAVDSELSDLSDAIDAATAASGTALTVIDTASIDFTASGTLSHTLTGSVKLSTAVSDNLITLQSDGLHVAPQTLSVDYSAKTLTVSTGNTVSFASLLSSSSGWLGNLASDPSATDGQYYWNTSTPALRIKVNGVWRTIATS